MKIIQICEFSSGICGVWSRVYQESRELVKKGHKVYVLSSNVNKSTEEIVSSYESKDGIEIYRFPSKTGVFDKLLSKNVTYFDFKKRLIDINPDVVITHLIHPHSFKALKICKILNKPCLLVTHAPFNVPRSFPLNIATKIYYSLNKRKIKSFSKIIAITNWEVPYLLSLGVPKEKIVIIPNSINDYFFKQKTRAFLGKKVLFFGRVAPVKDIETLVKAFIKVSKDYHKLNLDITGPVENGYEKIKLLSSQKIYFNKSVEGINEKIAVLQDCDIFVLPSKREGLPISLIDAMSLGKVVISSKTDGGKEVITDGINGFLFSIGDYEELSSKIEQVLKIGSKEIKLIQKNSRIRAKDFESKKVINTLNNLLKSYDK
ncbi:MAG: glycosyltransferase family 4 protein [Nanoarchaeota archaeon]